MKVGGLHCGIGSILGFKEARFQVSYLYDDRPFMTSGKEVLMKNFPEMLFVTDMQRFKDSVDVDVLISSPSCAQVSALGIKRADREDLFKATLDDFQLVETFKLIFESGKSYDYIVIEYLPSVLKWLGLSRNGIEQRFSKEEYRFPEEYTVQFIDLNTSLFDLGQDRNRLFMIFSKKGLDFYYIPMVLESRKPKTVKDILLWLDYERKQGPLLDDEPPKHSKKRIEGFDRLPEGKSYYGGPNNKRLGREKLCPVIASSKTQHIHPWYPRVLTPRECATFQGFPLDFSFEGCGFTTKLDLIGRSVSPVIAKDIAEQIIKNIKTNRG